MTNVTKLPDRENVSVLDTLAKLIKHPNGTRCEFQNEDYHIEIKLIDGGHSELTGQKQ